MSSGADDHELYGVSVSDAVRVKSYLTCQTVFTHLHTPQPDAMGQSVRPELNYWSRTPTHIDTQGVSKESL